MSAFIEANRDDPAIGTHIGRLAVAFGGLQRASTLIARRAARDPEEAGAASTDYLRLFGYVALGFLWAKAAKIAAAKLPTAGDDAAFYEAKLVTARFFFDRVLPETAGLAAAIEAGKASMMALDDASF